MLLVELTIDPKALFSENILRDLNDLHSHWQKKIMLSYVMLETDADLSNLIVLYEYQALVGELTGSQEMKDPQDEVDESTVRIVMIVDSCSSNVKNNYYHKVIWGCLGSSSIYDDIILFLSDSCVWIDNDIISHFYEAMYTSCDENSRGIVCIDIDDALITINPETNGWRLRPDMLRVLNIILTDYPDAFFLFATARVGEEFLLAVLDAVVKRVDPLSCNVSSELPREMFAQAPKCFDSFAGDHGLKMMDQKSHDQKMMIEMMEKDSAIIVQGIKGFEKPDLEQAYSDAQGDLVLILDGSQEQIHIADLYHINEGQLHVVNVDPKGNQPINTSSLFQEPRPLSPQRPLSPSTSTFMCLNKLR